MHVDLVALEELWQVDREMSEIRAQVEELGSAVRKASEHIRELEQEHTSLLAQRDAVQKQIHETRRKCETYIRKRDTTRKMIDEGRAPDYLVAEKQYRQCAEIVDELEFQELELDEQKDELDLLIRSLEQRQEKGLAQARTASEAQSSQRPGLVERYQHLKPQRVSSRENVARHLLGTYDSLRDRDRIPLVPLVSDRCSHCHIGCPPQMVIEVCSGKRPHNCRGCGAWLLPPLEEEEESG